jgi:23S rRNA (cytosine1962-C5)-methyltransferase
MRVWKVKKGSDIRIRSGHPWVFSNELTDSPKSVQPGEPVELTDMKGNFLARGYGNPGSLIAFRAMVFESHNQTPTSSESVVNKLIKSWKNRYLFGFKTSFRLCFSEADFLPGLIIDRYLIEHEGKPYQVFSYQQLTAGMNVIFKDWENIFKLMVQHSLDNQFSAIDWDHTLVLSRNDVNIRKLEGLEIEVPKVQKAVDGIDLNSVKILIQSVWDGDRRLSFDVNLIEGQKTGFFLDQTHNMKLLIEALKPRLKEFENKPLRIIDLCCYMGQWSAHIVHFLEAHGVKSEVTLVDVSDLALKMAVKNLEQFKTAKVKYVKADVLEGLTSFPESSFDVVISDPPAFVKNKRDLETGMHGYMKLNQQAFRIAAHSGLVISCTCSGLVSMTDFKASLRKAVTRSGKKSKIVCEGGLGWDHPQLVQFPEGQYLKMIMSSVE